MDFHTKRRTIDLIRTALEPVAAREQCDLVAVEVLGPPIVLRLSIDAANGVGIDDCARFSKAASPVLDVEDPFAGEWSLEVSSPGMQRPLQRLDDFVKFKGYRAKIRLPVGEPRRKFTGILDGVEDQMVHIEVDGVRHSISFVQIEKANLDLTLEQYQQLGSAEPKEATP